MFHAITNLLIVLAQIPKHNHKHINNMILCLIILSVIIIIYNIRLRITYTKNLNGKQ